MTIPQETRKWLSKIGKRGAKNRRSSRDLMIATINKQLRISKQLRHELGREPTSEEIATRMNGGPARKTTVPEIHAAVKRCKGDKKKAAKMLGINFATVYRALQKKEG
jgi:transcriptional regulator with PAS, ATPase and Fis domain